MILSTLVFLAFGRVCHFQVSICFLNYIPFLVCEVLFFTWANNCSFEKQQKYKLLIIIMSLIAKNESFMNANQKLQKKKPCVMKMQFSLVGFEDVF